MKKIIAILAILALVAALTVPAFAVEFTPSAENKDAPEVVQQTDADGNDVDVLVYDENGNLVPDTADYSVVITPSSRASAAPNAEIAEQLQEAKEQVGDADSVASLTSGMHVALSIAKAASSDAADQDVEMEDLVVYDLFDVTLMKDGDIVEDLDGSVTFSIQTTLTPDDMFFVLHNFEGDDWEVVENVSLDENGVLTITLTGFSPIAIVTVGQTAPAAAGDGAPTSPQTGESVSLWMILGVVFAAAAAVMFTVGRKSRTEA